MVAACFIRATAGSDEIKDQVAELGTVTPSILNKAFSGEL